LQDISSKEDFSDSSDSEDNEESDKEGIFNFCLLKIIYLFRIGQ
jgi:hypothetical protein